MRQLYAYVTNESILSQVVKGDRGRSQSRIRTLLSFTSRITYLTSIVAENDIYRHLYFRYARFCHLDQNLRRFGNQSGFRSIHSTVTAPLEATDTWAYNIDGGKINAIVFLDLKKTFDTVDHEILLSKLNFYGINGIAHHWFQSYLEDRTQMRSINGLFSSSCFLSCGVPQGTILGPLLFSIICYRSSQLPVKLRALDVR